MARSYQAWEDTPPDINDESYVQASARFGELFRILIDLNPDRSSKELVYEFESCGMTMNTIYAEQAYARGFTDGFQYAAFTLKSAQLLYSACR